YHFWQYRAYFSVRYCLRKILRLIVLFIESLESRADAVRAVCRVFPPVFLNIKGKRVGKGAQRPAGVGTFTKNAAG
ncbi:MAG: hypothetical protein ACLRH1_09980, partial [Acutalibacteraceae bacterium]